MKALRIAASCSVVLALGALRCGGVRSVEPPPPDAPAAEVPTIPRGQLVEGPLAFPPEDAGYRARPTLPPERGGAHTEPLALDTELDADGALVLHARLGRLRFSQPVRGAETDQPLEGVAITPAVGVAATWENDHTLRLELAQFLDPKQRYELSLPTLKGASGTALTMKLPLVSDSAATVGGKLLSYRPVPGQPEPVAFSDFGEVSPNPTIEVMFDQPVTLGQARQQLWMGNDAGQTIDLGLRRPPLPVFAGRRMDPRLLVQVLPRRPLDPGESVVLRAKGTSKTREARMKAATPMRFTGVKCSWYPNEDEICELKKGVLRTNRREVHLTFNRRVQTPNRGLKSLVRVTPQVRNLVVRNAGWDQRIRLTGDFRPSTSYRVSVAGLKDRFGQALVRPVELTVEVDPLGASATIPEGLVQLDAGTTAAFPITSRNVAEAELMLWRIEETPKAFAALQGHVRQRTTPTGPPDVSVTVPVAVEPDALVTTTVDLRKHLPKETKGQGFIATVEARTFAYDAGPLPASPAARRPVAWVRPFDGDRLAVHAQASDQATLVRVSRLADGEPRAGATVTIGDPPRSATTDAHGVALLPVDARSEGHIHVAHGGRSLLWPVDAGREERARNLFANLVGERVSRLDREAFATTDRGIYRPGERVHVKASLFAVGKGGLSALANQPVSLEVTADDGEVLCNLRARTTRLGGVAGDCDIPASARLGRYEVSVREDADVLTKTTLRVAEYERPRFKVDVEGAANGGALHAEVRSQYLFGGALSGGYASWTLRRESTSLPAGPLAKAGLRFSKGRSWYDDDAEAWSTSGDGTLDADGRLAIDREIPFPVDAGPQRLVIEADVHDESYRHIAGRDAIVLHPAPRYAGLSGPAGWVPARGSIEVDLGVADQEGQPVVGVPVGARLERVSWRYLSRRGPGGSRLTEWKRSEQVVGRCSAMSAAQPQSCRLRVPKSGDYRLVAEVDGRDGGTSWFWAWGEGDVDDGPKPNRGPVVPLATDRRRYQAGDTAKVLVRSPYPAATALVVRHRDGFASHQVQRIDGAAGVLEVPITAADAPSLALSVTLLPIGAEGEDAAGYRVGATRIPVALDGARLEVAVKSDRDRYGPGDRATVTVEVTRGGKPAPGAEVMLAAVDEGVLRMTGFHVVDPVAQLHRRRGLSDFTLLDSRSALLDVYGRSQVAGDGGSLPDVSQTRREMVQTALWRPAITTDAKGRATATFTLADDLTEYRMMAVATDAGGRGGRAETGFHVSKELLVQPILPRFALQGDDLELAAMVHNTSEGTFTGEVVIDGVATPVELPRGQRKRIAVHRKLDQVGDETVRVEVRRNDGTVADAVERPLTVQVPGVEHVPSLAGAFEGEQVVKLTIPASARFAPGTALEVKVGEHLWPELDRRLEYLLDYPHGCVEQTTSSTLPLLAARHILPRIGSDERPPSFYETRIRAGIERLSTMRTASGGLGYWPGASKPHSFGTAYALRAVVRAEDQGIAIPEGMKKGMVRYLKKLVVDDELSPGERVFMAESLARAAALPVGIGDALWGLRGELDAFGRASLALALGREPIQADRVRELLDDLEGAVDARGRLAEDATIHHHFGARSRTEAQIALALSALRPGSKALVGLTQRIANHPGSYTTQTTAFGLLALADHLRGSPEGGGTVGATLDGEPVAAARKLGTGRAFRIPLAQLRGRGATLRLSSSGTAGFGIAARYRLPVDDAGEASGLEGPHLYRAFTRPDGSPVDLSQVKAGETVRVSLLARWDDDDDERHHLAIVDHLPAGFAPIDTTLDTVAARRDPGGRHPWRDALYYGYNTPDHLELRDDRVQIYVDQVRSDEVAVSYLVRATTPGTFTLPPATAELMYAPQSHSRTGGGKVVIR